MKVTKKDIELKVIFTKYNKPEEGVITSFNDRYVFVRFEADMRRKFFEELYKQMVMEKIYKKIEELKEWDKNPRSITKEGKVKL